MCKIILNLYIYTAVLVKIYLKFKFAGECFDLSTIGILSLFIELSPFFTNFSLFVPNSQEYNSVYKIYVPFTFRKLVFLLFFFLFILSFVDTEYVKERHPTCSQLHHYFVLNTVSNFSFINCYFYFFEFIRVVSRCLILF